MCGENSLLRDDGLQKVTYSMNLKHLVEVFYIFILVYCVREWVEFLFNRCYEVFYIL